MKEREATFIKAAPQFGPQFPKDAADHLEQVAALKRAKSSSSHSVGFKASSSQWSSHQSYAPRQRPKPYARPKAAIARKASQVNK